MKNTHDITPHGKSKLNVTSTAIWAQLEPYLDEIMASLSEKDRAVLALRYFENKSINDISQVLKLSGEAVQKHTNHALERLKQFYEKRGVSLPIGEIVTAISKYSVKAPPPLGLASKITTSVMRQQHTKIMV